MNGEGCDICEMANIRVRRIDTASVPVDSGGNVTVGIFACDGCYKDHVKTEFIAEMIRRKG
jgi:hypothetical protein